MSQRIDYIQQSPELFKAYQAFSNAVRHSAVDATTRDLVQIRASQINSCAFCLDMHVKEARIHGERELRLHHVAIWRESSLFSARERAALEWTEALTRLSGHGVPDTIYNTVREQLSEKNKQLTVLLERNKELATRDELTGAFNRRHLMEALAVERERARRTDDAFSVAILDLDWFKAINDRHGHAGGDAVLRAFCDLARAEQRANDLFARYGGEEFVLMMPATATPDGARCVVERIRHAVAAHGWGAVLGEQAPAVTVSAGIATWRRDESPEAVLARADAALYDAKHLGRNRSVLAGGVPDERLVPA